jgi:hypothetical protein
MASTDTSILPEGVIGEVRSTREMQQDWRTFDTEYGRADALLDLEHLRYGDRRHLLSLEYEVTLFERTP